MVFDRTAVLAEMDDARERFHRLLASAQPADLARGTNGTRWTNEQLLFHMLFGYMVVLRLQLLVRVFGRLPDSVSREFARLLDAGTRPFDAVNYYGSCGGALVYDHRRMGRKFDRVIAALQRRVSEAGHAQLALGMYYPTRWDPFFRPYMRLSDIFHYPTQHFDFHARQLTLTDAAAVPTGAVGSAQDSPTVPSSGGGG